MASQGLTSTLGSLSMGRTPGFSARMKQSCRLSNAGLAASSRFGSANRRQRPIERSRTKGWRILLTQPTNWVARRRGIRLVSKKLSSSCWPKRANMDRAVTEPEGDVDDIGPLCVECGRHRRHHRIDGVGAPDCDTTDVVQGEAPLAARPREDVALLRQAGALLRVR